ncbi:MAG: type II toxin-antitoxin system death-on-curing family toxin [Flavobacteriales bacterium]|nr:type II toxin-antitoxin system death-on-curing family toxin [Flavobacteriales bacterium]MBP9177418.1 type II toxin-antitoxin system death-on-curing family toxin [Flavobacteriales bacterium]MCC6911012.1 type II toxin-antitoxin system death-on-curing family toxin [Flavobacteriales bacterium]
MESALARPFQTFGGEDLYTTPAAEAAALMESIVINHPWVDGNKRTGLGLAMFLLMKEGYRVKATQMELYDLTIGVAEGRTGSAAISAWISERIEAI